MMEDLRDNLDTILPALNKLLIKRQEQIVVDVLKQYLKREPTVEDYRKVTLIHFTGWEMKYDIKYEDVVLGSFKMSFDGGTAMMAFTWNENIKL